MNSKYVNNDQSSDAEFEFAIAAQNGLRHGKNNIRGQRKYFCKRCGTTTGWLNDGKQLFAAIKSHRCQGEIK